MIALADLLLELLDSVPSDAGDERSGIRVSVSEVTVKLPVEARLGRDGTLRASAPRGQLATGFDPPCGELRVAFSRGIE